MKAAWHIGPNFATPISIKAMITISMIMTFISFEPMTWFLWLIQAAIAFQVILISKETTVQNKLY